MFRAIPMTSMYLNYFGLAEAPFSIAPNPRYLYMSQRHQEALAHLLYGVSGEGGFVLLTGEVGTGKTTVCRGLLDQVPADCEVAYVFNPKLTVEELLSTICAEFGIDCPPGNPTIKTFVDCINVHLLKTHARGRHSVLIIDEAQNLSAEVLEQMRLLTNLETNERKLLQIILIGQPELATMLDRPELRQLAQRIVARYHLGPLTRAEISAYVRHRLEVAGTQRQLFPLALMRRLHLLSGGIPRLVNVLCDRALLGAYVQGRERVDRTTLDRAAREIFHQSRQGSSSLKLWMAGALVLLAGGALAFLAYQNNQVPIENTAKPQAETASVAAVPARVEAKPESEPKLPETLSWPAGQPIAQSQALAYAALFHAWGAAYGGGDACKQAVQMGLACRSGHGGLDELREWNRPAVLRMHDDKGTEFYAALTALHPKSATFIAGNQMSTVALAVLASQWSGDYSLLTRLPPAIGGPVKPGDRGLAVAWVGRQLARVQNKPADLGTNPVFDDAMSREVRQFQLDQGLAPDGIVGRQTLSRLASVADQTAPKLVRAEGDN
jgi:general secretion pathway protein A